MLAYIIAVILVAAGVYQLSPLKQLGLRECRSPLGFLLAIGARAAGAPGPGPVTRRCTVSDAARAHAVLVAAGAMGLPWVLLITAVVAAES